ncbi:uncharacterized protein [Drosophila bipectinata]|uniref:uncharacterized protein n=1 Tax=Drosophila bipectinata TaxID=42026 RepID=UPI001C897AA6|nr:uncharacterized protein LOC108133534 [Drosophila bipectinata]
MAFVEEAHFAFAKKVALDWRELVREKKFQMLETPTESLANVESLVSMARSKARTSSMFTAERRESSFYRATFSKPPRELEIERRAGSMDPDRIRVNEDLNLYIYPPVQVTEEARMSLLLDPISVSVMSPISPIILSNLSLVSKQNDAESVKSFTG